MAETPLTVDLSRLRAVASRVERSAEAINRFRFTGLDPGELEGSAVCGIASPAHVAARLDDVVARMRWWAAAARMSAGAFEDAEHTSVARFDRS